MIVFIFKTRAGTIVMKPDANGWNYIAADKAIGSNKNLDEAYKEAKQYLGLK